MGASSVSRTDLHGLILRYGLPHVGMVIGVTPRALLDLRSGKTALTVDDLLELSRAFRSFDLAGTVARIGALRLAAGRSRSSRSGS